MINNPIIYKFFKDFTNHRKKTNRAVVFSYRTFPNILKYRTTLETFQQLGKQDSLRCLLKNLSLVVATHQILITLKVKISIISIDTDSNITDNLIRSLMYSRKSGGKIIDSEEPLRYWIILVKTSHPEPLGAIHCWEKTK